MRPDLAHKSPAGASQAGLLRHLDPRFKLLATVFFVLVAVLIPVGAWRMMGLLGLILSFLIGLSGLPPRALFLRWFGFFLLVGFLAATAAPAMQARTQFGLPTVMASIVLKNSLAFVAMMILAGVTPWHELLPAMRNLGVPRVLVATLQFMERYLHVLREELRRMWIARRARSFGSRGGLSWSLLTGMIGMLMLRTFERAERVQAAMVSRGWDGTIRSLDD